MFEITSTTRVKLPALPYERLKNAALGKSYDLSLVIVGDARSRHLNHIFRKKDYPANVLSFPLDRSSGEMFLNIRAVEREAKRDGLSVKKRLFILYVHGLAHLKGFDHGPKMDKFEQNIFAKIF